MIFDSSSSKDAHIIRKDAYDNIVNAIEYTFTQPEFKKIIDIAEKSRNESRKM